MEFSVPDGPQFPQLCYVLRYTNDDTNPGSRYWRSEMEGNIAGSVAYVPPMRLALRASDDFRRIRNGYCVEEEVFDLYLPPLMIVDTGVPYFLVTDRAPTGLGDELVTPFSVFPHVYADARVCTDLTFKSATFHNQKDLITYEDLSQRHIAAVQMYFTGPMIYWDDTEWTPVLDPWDKQLTDPQDLVISIRTNEYRSWEQRDYDENPEDFVDEEYGEVDEDDLQLDDVVGWGETGMQLFLDAWSGLTFEEVMTFPYLSHSHAFGRAIPLKECYEIINRGFALEFVQTSTLNNSIYPLADAV